MKKIISLLTSVAMSVDILAMGTVLALADNERYVGKRGDVNADSKTDIVDVVMLRSNIVGTLEFTSDQKLLGDMNSDENIDIVDVVMLRNVVVNGLSTDDVYASDTDTDTDTNSDSDTFSEIDTQGDTDTISEVDSDTQSDTSTDITTDTDTDTATDTETLEEGIFLKGSYAETGYENVAIEGKVVTISEPGTYAIYGEISDGQIVVSVDKDLYPDGKVELELNGVTITNSSDSPIYIEEIDDECVITAKKGTTNTITDGENYTNADGKAAAIYAKDDIKFKGKGTLIVNGKCDEGIACKNDIKIWNSTIIVNAVGDAIRGKDSVRIGDPDDTEFPNLYVSVSSSSEDGIKSTNDEDEGEGFIRINGGTVTVYAKYDGIKAEQALEINGGDITVNTYEGYSATNITTDSDGNDSAKGLKCVGLYDENDEYLSAGTIDLNGGNITIDSSDDAVHCAGTLTVNGANLYIKTGDDGLHSDSDLYIKSGLIEVYNSYEGVEGENIYIEGGTTYVTASDDGLNAAGGDGSGQMGPGGWNQGGGPGGMGGPGGGFNTGGTTTDTNYMITISGGYTVVNAQGDGIDSNGSISMTGGTTIVYGTTSGGNGIIDIGDSGNCTFTVSGSAIFFGVGTNDMYVAPTSGAYIKNTSLNASANSYVGIKDSSGNLISVIKTPKSARALIYCNASENVNSCSVVKGDSYTGTLDTYGYSTGGTIS